MNKKQTWLSLGILSFVALGIGAYVNAQELPLTTVVTQLFGREALVEGEKEFKYKNDLVINPDGKALESGPIQGKITTDVLTAKEFNRLLEMAAEGGANLPSCVDGEILVYDELNSDWKCGVGGSGTGTGLTQDVCAWTDWFRAENGNSPQLVPVGHYVAGADYQATTGGNDGVLRIYHCEGSGGTGGVTGGTGSPAFHTCNNDGTAVKGTDEACTAAQADGGKGTDRYRAFNCKAEDYQNVEVASNLWYRNGSWSSQVSNTNVLCTNGTIVVADLEGSGGGIGSGTPGTTDLMTPNYTTGYSSYTGNVDASGYDFIEFGGFDAKGGSPWGSVDRGVASTITPVVSGGKAAINLGSNGQDAHIKIDFNGNKEMTFSLLGNDGGTPKLAFVRGITVGSGGGATGGGSTGGGSGVVFIPPVEIVSSNTTGTVPDTTVDVSSYLPAGITTVILEIEGGDNANLANAYVIDPNTGEDLLLIHATGYGGGDAVRSSNQGLYPISAAGELTYKITDNFDTGVIVRLIGYVGGSGGGSMKPGWPDAIKCSVTAPQNWGSEVFFYLAAGDYSSKVAYRFSHAERYVDISYNLDKTFNSSGYKEGNGSGPALTTDCSGKSIDDLYAEGKAFNFGGGSTGTGGTTSLNNIGCADGQVLSGFDENGDPKCTVLGGGNEYTTSPPMIFELNTGAQTTDWTCWDNIDLKDYCGDYDGCVIKMIMNHKTDANDQVRVIDNHIYMEEPDSFSSNKKTGQVYGWTRQDGGDYAWINGSGTRTDTITGPWGWSYIYNFKHSYCPEHASHKAYPANEPYKFSFMTHPHVRTKYIVYDSYSDQAPIEVIQDCASQDGVEVDGKCILPRTPLKDLAISEYGEGGTRSPADTPRNYAKLIQNNNLDEGKKYAFILATSGERMGERTILVDGTDKNKKMNSRCYNSGWLSGDDIKFSHMDGTGAPGNGMISYQGTFEYGTDKTIPSYTPLGTWGDFMTQWTTGTPLNYTDIAAYTSACSDPGKGGYMMYIFEYDELKNIMDAFYAKTGSAYYKFNDPLSSDSALRNNHWIK